MGACSGRDGERALLALSRHDPARALRLFRSALDGCPVTDEKELARLLYFLGIALLRLGQKDAAMDSWRAAHRLKQRTYALKMLRRYANCYGMERQTDGELDDWKAFLSIQVERYLASKRNRRFSSEPERDMVRDLVFEYWRAIRASDVLDGRGARRAGEAVPRRRDRVSLQAPRGGGRRGDSGGFPAKTPRRACRSLPVRQRTDVHVLLREVERGRFGEF